MKQTQRRECWDISDEETEEQHLLVDGTKEGLAVWQTVMMIAGTVAGSGVLALPSAVESTGWIGTIMIMYLCMLSGYTGAALGWSWTIVEQRYLGKANVHTQDPYPLIGEKALGRVGRILVKISVYVVTFGGGAVYLLLAADIVSNLIRTLGHQEFSICYTALIIGCILIPMNWLGTPVDFWPMGLFALASTAGATIICTAYTVYLRFEKRMEVEHPPVEAGKFFMAMGSMAFTLAGHPSFPSIQQDMKNRRSFDLAVVIAFTILFLMYLLMTLPSYFLLGGMVGSNILTTLSGIQRGWPVTIAEIALLTHLFTAYLIVINPVNQDMEDIFKVPNQFCLGRVLIRTSVMVIIIFMSESIPRFGVLLSLVGGTAITMSIYILPVCAYEALCRQDGPWERIRIPWYRRALHAEILIIGILVFVSATYFALLDILGPDTFVPPCYLNATAAHI